MQHVGGEQGSVVFEVVLVALLMVAAGYGVYQTYEVHQAQNAPVGSTTTGRAAMTHSSPQPVGQTGTTTQLSSVTPLNGTGPLQLALPAGWQISGSQVSATIGGIDYVVEFQITPSDWLQANYGGGAFLLASTKTANGTQVYVVNTNDNYYVALSSCPPRSGNGCSLTQDGKLLFVLMHSYQPGDQFVRGLDFTNPATSTAITQFEAIASSLRL